ncbi:UNVERIFIED_CONTAM: hypothetical protein FKN15_031410 [Acipenser sinensis]
MEDHLKNKNRLEKEWEALCAYQAEPNAATVAQRAENAKKNRTDKVPVCAKEIDIAATLEHLRDQRPGMVQTKEQFEFALTAVAEEVNAILKALPQ